MHYYNRKGKKLKMEEAKYLSSGACASVSHDNTIIYKEYFSNSGMNLRIDSEMFDALKDINNRHFIKLIEIYKKMSALEFIKYKLSDKKFIVDLYTAKYYEDDTANPLYEPIDYILDNLNGIEKLFEIFTDKRIITEDIKRKNAILGHNTITIIDPDLFRFADYQTQDHLAVLNKNELINLFRSICLSCFKTDKEKDKYFQKIYLDLTGIGITKNTNVTSEIYKKLKHVKKPIDYLTK